jgi:hypothetical protein
VRQRRPRGRPRDGGICSITDDSCPRAAQLS